MKLTLGQAAKECGKSKSTLSKAIASGKLSVAGKSTAGYEIDPAELFRVFPKNGENPNDSNDRKPHENGITNAEREGYEMQIRLLREMIDRAENQADEWHKQADEWRKQAQTLAVSHDKEPKPAAGFWARLTGRAA